MYFLIKKTNCMIVSQVNSIHLNDKNLEFRPQAIKPLCKIRYKVFVRAHLLNKLSKLLYHGNS